MDIETENIEQVLDEPAEVYLEQEYPSYSRLAEGFLLFLGTILICEGVFTAYFRAVLDEKLLWWTRLTPYRLFPSELIFYGPALLISFFVVLRGRTAGYKTARGLWLLLPFWIVGAIQAVHGRLAGIRAISGLPIFGRRCLCPILRLWFVSSARGLEPMCC